ncbi:MAG: hypothetical protein HN337_02555 [Deltaproteobacteria bacterium]|jgi:hypothetical protein|nr:hypothetical protein [Deltaproteobacteria bacterium]
MERTELYVNDRVASKFRLLIRLLSFILFSSHLVSLIVVVVGIVRLGSDLPLVDVIFKTVLSITALISLFWIIVSVGLWAFRETSRDLAILLVIFTVLMDFLVYWFVGFQVFTMWTCIWLALSVCLFLIVRTKVARLLFGMPPRGRMSALLKSGSILMMVAFLTTVIGSFLYIRIVFYKNDWNALLKFGGPESVKIQKKVCEGDCERVYFCNFSFEKPKSIELYNLVVGEDGCRIGFSSDKSKLTAIDNYDYLSPLAVSLKYKSPYALERNIRLAKYRPLYLLFKKVNLLYDSLHSDFIKYDGWKGFVTYVKSKGVEIKLYQGPPWNTVDIFMASDNGASFPDTLRDWFGTFNLDETLWGAARSYGEAKSLRKKGKLPEAAIYFAEAYHADPDNPEYAYEYLKIKQELGIWTFGYEVERIKNKFPDDDRFDKFLSE